jgi:hypothetical protein
MTRKRNLLCTGLCTATLLLTATGAMAGKVERTPNNPAINGSNPLTNPVTGVVQGPQLNRCWGEIASQLAQLPTDGTANGGAMGLHSKDNNAPDATFRDSFLFDPNVTNRAGIGNGTANVDGPHGIAPADGGLGQHAINNGTTTSGATFTSGGVSNPGQSGFSNLLDPRTGDFLTAPPDYSLTCSLDPTVP